MKTLVPYLLIVCCLLSCNNFTKDAIEYNDAIVKKGDKAVALIMKLDSILSGTLNMSYQDVYNQLKAELQKQLNEIDSIKPFNGTDNDLKNGYHTLLKSYNDVVNNELKSIGEWLSLPDSLYTDEITNNIQNTLTIAYKKLDDADVRFIEVQKQFATKYNFELDSLKNK